MGDDITKMRGDKVRNIKGKAKEIFHNAVIMRESACAASKYLKLTCCHRRVKPRLRLNDSGLVSSTRNRYRLVTRASNQSAPIDDKRLTYKHGQSKPSIRRDKRSAVVCEIVTLLHVIVFIQRLDDTCPSAVCMGVEGA